MADERDEHTDSTTAITEAGRRQEGRVSTPGEAPAEVSIGDVRFECLANAHYHQDMERFYDWAHRAAMFMIVVAGTSAVADLAVVGARKPAAIAAVVGLADLVFDVFGKAHRHGQLRWRALDVYSDTFERTADAAILLARLARLYPDEPPTNATVNRLAYNRAAEALGWKKRDILPVPWFKRMTRHVLPIWSFDIPDPVDPKDATT